LDDLAHYLLEKGTPTYGRIVESFGPEVVLADGAIDREALAREAFSSAEKTRKLNSLMHPEIAREVGTSLTELRLMPEHQPESVVLEVPLLAEAPVFAEVADVVLAISAPVSVRAARAQTRGMSAEDVLRRIERQATDEDRAEFADVVIVNDGDLETFERELAEFWDANVATGGATAR
jgi:dephospho-CoA kinase